MFLNLDKLEPNQSVSGLENIFEMQDESKSTLAVSNWQNFTRGCNKDLHKQALPSWAKVLQKCGGSAPGSKFTFYRWRLCKFSKAPALQNHSISLWLD